MKVLALKVLDPVITIKLLTGYGSVVLDKKEL